MTRLPRMLAEDRQGLERLADVQILYTDLDGTLLGHGGTLLVDGEGAPSANAAEAIVAVNRAGLPVVITSGRSAGQLVEVARMCGWNDFIAEAGSVRSVWRDGQRSTTYDTGDWPKGILAPGKTPLDLINQAGAFEALESAFPGCVEHHEPWHLNRSATDVLRGRLPQPQAQVVLDSLPLKVDLLDNGIIRRRSPGLSCEGPLHAYHLVPHGVSKRRAVARDLAERGIAPERAALIGDSDTDLECARVVGLVAMVNNALEVVGMQDRLTAHDNAYTLEGERGDGWAEFARLWLRERSAA